MPGFIKKMLIVLVLVLLCFGGSFNINHTSMYIQPRLNIAMLIDWNLDHLITIYSLLVKTVVM